MAVRLTGPRARVYLIAVAVIVLVLAVYLAAPDFLQAVEVRLYDLHFKLRGTQARGTERIVIVAIDEKSLASLGRWPWPRTRLARARGGSFSICAASDRRRPTHNSPKAALR